MSNAPIANARRTRGHVTRAFALAVLAAMATLSACAVSVWPTDADFNICPNGNEPVSSVRLSQTDNAAMRVNDVITVRAELLDAQSSPMFLCVPSTNWTSDDVAVATVTDGRVVAVGVGQTVIRALAGGKTASFTVIVSDAALASLTLSQDTATLLVGQTLRFTAVGRDSSGATVPSQTIKWSTSDSSIATITSANKILVAHRLGTAYVRATVGNTVATARVDIVTGAPIVQVRDITAGWMHSCAIVGGGGIAEGTAYCWGEGSSGALGTGALFSRAIPTEVSGQLTFTSIHAGERGTCAIATSGAAYCWGDNYAGQLGDGSTVPYSSAPRMVGSALSFRVLRLGRALTCGLLASGEAYCWGAHANGIARAPIPVSGGRQYAELSANGGAVCARNVAGDAFCWDAQSPWHSIAPSRVSSTVPFTQISAGPYHNCAVSADRETYCWGSISGQLGTSMAPGTRTAATAVTAMQGFSTISAGGNFTCGSANGQTSCIGNTSLGDTPGLDQTPRRLPNDDAHPFVRLSSGSFHGCAIDALGGGWCFGRSLEGQLGAGDYVMPVPVPLQLRFAAP